MVAENMFEVVVAVDPDWGALEWIRANPWRGNTTLVRAHLVSGEYQRALTEARHEVIIGNVCRKFDDQGVEEKTARGEKTSFTPSWDRELKRCIVVTCGVFQGGRLVSSHSWNRRRVASRHRRCQPQLWQYLQANNDYSPQRCIGEETQE